MSSLGTEPAASSPTAWHSPGSFYATPPTILSESTGHLGTLLYSHFYWQRGQSLQKEVFGPLKEVADVELPLTHLTSLQGQAVTETACHQQKSNCSVSFLRKPFLGNSTCRGPLLPLTTELCLVFFAGLCPKPKTFFIPSVCQQFLVSGRQVAVLVLYCLSKTFYCASSLEMPIQTSSQVKQVSAFLFATSHHPRP